MLNVRMFNNSGGCWYVLENSVERKLEVVVNNETFKDIFENYPL